MSEKPQYYHGTVKWCSHRQNKQTNTKKHAKITKNTLEHMMSLQKIQLVLQQILLYNFTHFNIRKLHKFYICSFSQPAQISLPSYSCIRICLQMFRVSVFLWWVFSSRPDALMCEHAAAVRGNVRDGEQGRFDNKNRRCVVSGLGFGFLTPLNIA